MYISIFISTTGLATGYFFQLKQAIKGSNGNIKRNSIRNYSLHEVRKIRT